MPFELINATEPMALFNYPNTVTGGQFWNLILLAIFVVSYLGISKRSNNQKSFAASGFLLGVIASFFFVLGWIEVLPLLISLVVALSGFILLLFKG